VCLLRAEHRCIPRVASARVTDTDAGHDLISMACIWEDDKIGAMSVQCGKATENAGVENAGADSKGGKCRSRQAVWKAEPI